MKLIVGVLAGVAWTLAPVTSDAQEVPTSRVEPASGVEPESGVEPASSESLPPPHPGTIFDREHTKIAYALDLGPIAYRPAASTRRGFAWGPGEIRLGLAYTSTWKAFYIAGFHQLAFRAFDAASYSIAPLVSRLAGGVRVGPIEPEVTFGVALLTADVFHGDYSFQMLSPRVGVGIGLRFGKIRLDFEAHTEYSWRWFGPDYLIRGVSVGLRFDVPRRPPTQAPR